MRPCLGGRIGRELALQAGGGTGDVTVLGDATMGTLTTVTTRGYDVRLLGGGEITAMTDANTGTTVLGDTAVAMCCSTGALRNSGGSVGRWNRPDLDDAMALGVVPDRNRHRRHFRTSR
ncbi:MAG: hypothetical protein U5R48_14880 [Gammaproteobacteria bacterium]|nr:hypothetical protein [Gammaproteobacteria bacterium]